MGFSIEKAEDQGYFVAGKRMISMHEDNLIRCAGTLVECLAYIQKQFEEAEAMALVTESAE